MTKDNIEKLFDSQIKFYTKLGMNLFAKELTILKFTILSDIPGVD